ILLVAGLTLLTSFLCSLLEAALYSVTPSQVEVLKQREVKGARRLEALRADIDAPIAAILTVNTIAHTVGSALCGAMVAAEFGSPALGIFATLFTFAVLALTEIVPKSLGVRYARTLAVRTVVPLQLMMWSVWPIVWAARRSMRALAGGKGRKGPTEEEIVLFARLAVRGGTVRTQEYRWVQNALYLDRFTAGDLRTPRPVVDTQPAERRVGDLVQEATAWAHSRIPITEGGSADGIIGLVHRLDILEAAAADQEEQTLRELMQPIHFVPDTMPAHQLLELFLRERKHLVAVTDEYGGFEGVVTLEDVLECLLGEEIVDEHDEIEDMQQLALRQSRIALHEGEAEPQRG
ncbi:MAG: hemolysin family protein, partial [Thermoanaerobaculia bacterium]